MDFNKYIKDKVKKNLKTIVFPEYKDDRMYYAAYKLIQKKLVKQIMICGNTDIIAKKAKELNINLNNIKVVSIEKNENFEKFASEFYELRKEKKITEEKARDAMKDELYFGAMMVRLGYADGMVAGASHSTADVVRSALQVVTLKEGVKTLSSYFVMCLTDSSYGEKGLLFFADCAVMPKPSPSQLSDIALSTAESMKKLIEGNPKIAFLSFSTKGSASHPDVERVVEAYNIFKQKRPDMVVDGELQVDTALIERVALKKASDSPIAGKANILIFPDLNSGNIAYKLTQYLGNAGAYGPILQGLKKPVNDLSRGCVVDDIVNVACMTQLMV